MQVPNLKMISLNGPVAARRWCGERSQAVSYAPLFSLYTITSNVTLLLVFFSSNRNGFPTG